MPKILRWFILASIIIIIISSSLLTVQPARAGNDYIQSRPTRYYLADRVINNVDFSKLAAWGINTAVVDFDVNGSATTWRAVFTSAAASNINVVVWPSDWDDPRPNCGWEAPYNVSAGGDITEVKPLLDVASQYSNFIGIINAHESFWTCPMTFDEMAGIKDQLKAYALSKGRAIKIFNYIDNLYDRSILPDNQIARIMDVAITWQHCAGNAESTCDSADDSNSALANILNDRKRINDAGLNGVVDLVYIVQTFTTGGYGTKFSLNQLENYSCEFLNTGALDGYGYYTWDAGWWPDLHQWADLQSAIPYVYQNCIGGTQPATATPGGPTATASNTALPTSIRTATALPTFSRTPTATSNLPTPTGGNPSAFTFVSASDGQGEVANFTRTVNQIKTIAPSFILFTGDLENNGVNVTEMNNMTAPLKSANLYNAFMPVRGNHDDPNSTVWEAYFETTAPKVLPPGVTNYVSMNSSTDFMNYSFVYGNSIFIGLDVPGDIDLLNSTQLAFFEARLVYAESQGLIHAFIFTHGPLYCAESTHCTCTSRTDASCTPSALVALINRHPIISAFLNGHEHLLAWAHLDNTRLAGLTGSFEEFFTSPAGGWTYNSYLYPARVDYYYPSMGTSQGFGAVTVNGNQFTTCFYKVGTSTAVWCQTFTKGIIAQDTPTPTVTRIVTRTPTPTLTRTPTAAQTATAIPPTATPTLTVTPTVMATWSPAPGLESPADGSSTSSHQPIFDWAGSGSFVIQISTSNTFATSSTYNVAVSNYRPASAWLHRTYYWRVKQTGGAWSPMRSVTIK